MNLKHRSLSAKIEELTYGLIYPAFFSHMVYNWIEIWINQSEIRNVDNKMFALLTGGFLILYYIIDYWHLKNDLDEIVPQKSWWYMTCDIITSLSLFIAMIFIQHDCTYGAIISFCIVPILTGSYNLQLRFYPTFQWSYMFLSLISVLFFFYLNIIITSDKILLWRELYLSIVVVSFTITYFSYNVRNYWGGKYVSSLIITKPG